MMKLAVAVMFVCALDITRGFSHSLEKRQAPQAAAAAAASDDECLCQCSSYTYVDAGGVTRGNCKSAYQGKLWCYTDEYDSLCDDLQASDSGRFWSFQACATPSRDSAVCSQCRPGGFC